MDAALVASPAQIAPVRRQHGVLHWYFTEAPARDLRRYLAFSAALFEVWSVRFLLKTLFSQWKGINEKYPEKGFHPGEILSTLALNLTSRLIGALVRMGVIIFAIFLQLSLLVGYAVYAAVWFAFPLLLPAGVVLILISFIA